MRGQQQGIAGTASLRSLLSERRALLAPGAANALPARVIEDLGYEIEYMTGAGVARISDACRLPLVVDMDTGLGNGLNAARSVRTLERAGAAAIQIEDQVFPKKCGHFAEKAIVEASEMVSNIKAFVDARHDQDLQIIARTDARAIDGLGWAVERAEFYRGAGADVLLVEAPVSVDELRCIGSLSAPQVASLVVGGQTPLLAQTDLAKLGFALVLYANAALQASLRAMQDVLAHLLRQGLLAEIEDRLTSFTERKRAVTKDAYDRLGARHRVVDAKPLREVV